MKFQWRGGGEGGGKKKKGRKEIEKEKKDWTIKIERHSLVSCPKSEPVRAMESLIERRRQRRRFPICVLFHRFLLFSLRIFFFLSTKVPNCNYRLLVLSTTGFNITKFTFWLWLSQYFLSVSSIEPEFWYSKSNRARERRRGRGKTWSLWYIAKCYELAIPSFDRRMSTLKKRNTK